LALDEGWTVDNIVERSPHSTGGFFSVGYLVRHTNGSVAFLKALDLSQAWASDDQPRVLQALTAAYNFERDLLGKCRAARLRRVAVALSDGAVEVPGFDPPLSRVNYIIFERADGDVRTHLDATEAFDLAWRLHRRRRPSCTRSRG